MSRKRSVATRSKVPHIIIINSIVLTAILLAGAVLLVQDHQHNGSPVVKMWRRALLTNSSSNGTVPYFNSSLPIPYNLPYSIEDASSLEAEPPSNPYASPIEPSPSRFFTFSTPVYRPDKYSVIVDRRFLVAIDNETYGFTKVVQGVADLQAASQPKVENVGFAGTGCVTISLVSNSSAVQTAVVAQLSEADLAAAPSNDSELPWSHCNGTCSITVPTDVNSTYATAVGGPPPYTFSTNFTLRPSGYSGCVKALNQLTTVQKNGFYYKPHPLVAFYTTPVVLISQTVSPRSAVVLAAMVNTSCTYLSGSMGDYRGGPMYLNLVEESTLAPFFNFGDLDANQVLSIPGCLLGLDCIYDYGAYVQYRLDPSKAYYLVLHNFATVNQNATIHLNIRDEGSCRSDDVKTQEYADGLGGQRVTLAPEAQKKLDQEGGEAACLAAGLTASCTAG